MNYKLILTNFFNYKNNPNLILYGHHSVDKYNILKEFLNINNCDEIIDNIRYYGDNNIKIFDMKDIKNSQIENFFIIILKIIKYKNYYSNNLRILIFKNFNYIQKNIQDRFRVIFEKYRISTLFIIITDNYNNILSPIKSRFLSIRISDLSQTDKISISYPYIKNLVYNERCKIYDTIYKYSSKDIIINYSKNNYGLLKDYSDIIKSIYNSLKNMKKLDLDLIKKYAYIFEKYNIKNIHSDLLKLMIEDLKMNMNIFKEIINNFSKIEMRYKKSFNRILSNELLLIFIHKKLLIYLEERK